MRLCVLIPYRERVEHLKRLLPPLIDQLRSDPSISVGWQIAVVEQGGRESFNKGALLNAGFLITEPLLDYVCFHDVDFVPINADYSPPDLPTRRIWEGAQARPRVPGGAHVINHRFDRFFGGVLVFGKEHFCQVNGFSNLYRGWGFEDGDLRERCRAANLGPLFGHGEFEPLDHANRGLNVDLSFTAEALVNRNLYRSRWCAPNSQANYKEEGLNTLSYRYYETRMLLDKLFGEESLPEVRHFVVHLDKISPESSTGHL